MNGFNRLLALLQRFVSNRWSQVISVGLLLTGLIWFYLPGLTFFQQTGRLVAAIAVVWAAVIAIAIFTQRKRDREEKNVSATLTEGGDAATSGQREGQAAAEEVRELRRRLTAAIATLRKRGVKRLYDMPWYVLIGPPGSGKTTSLRHSGLHFPLEDEGEDSLRGVGGTRLCDWWFADEAVLIDTAGRYTTQDSAKAVDRAGWLGFLESLRKARPRQPINGVIVMISLLDIAAGSPDTREAHARQVRLRINELTETLGIRIPVYLIFNKIDRLAGFEMFFDDLDTAARGQVWGTTFPVDGGMERFQGEFSLLLEQLDRRLIDRLQAERAPERRALMSGFPLQVASLAEPIGAFLESAFRGSKIDPTPFLRGVYLTSATQVGAPLDRLSGALARSFGIDQQRAGQQPGTRGRAYFLARLMREVILGEALLGAYAPDRYRRRRTLRALAFAAIAGITIAGIGLIWESHRDARAMVQAQFTRFAAYHDAIAPLAARKVDQDADLPAVSDALDLAKGLAPKHETGLASRLNVAPDQAAAQAGQGVYDNALARVLYPRLVWRLEHDMRERFQDPAFLYDATRVYLLLGGLGPHDPKIVESWFAADWGRRYPGALNQTLRDHLATHLAALLANPAPQDTMLDGDLVRRARMAFGHVTPAQRIYGRLRDLPVPADVPDWSPQDALGNVAGSVFGRRSNAPMTDGVPGFFTGAGYARIMRQELPAAARAVADESWVVGHDTAMSVRGSDASALEAEVAALWVQDASHLWNTTLNDLVIRLGGSPAEISGALYLLSSPQSPLRDMVRSIVQAETIPMPQGVKPDADQQTSGPDAPTSASAQSASGQSGAQSRNAARNAGQNLSRNALAASGAQPDGAPDTLLEPIDQAASDWNAAIAPMANLLHPPGGGAPPIETLTTLLGQLDNAVATGGTAQPNAPVAGVNMPDPGQRLRAEASRQPEPVATWLREIADAGASSRAQEVKATTSGTFNAPDGPGAACRALVKGHFPFDPYGKQDASLADFVRVFAPGGLMDRYVEQSVSPFVDRSGPTWKLHDAAGVHAPFTAAQLPAFQRVDAIRSAFFPMGGAPFLSLTVTLHADKDIVLTLGGVTVRPEIPANLTWPGSDGLSPATITRMPDSSVTTPGANATPSGNTKPDTKTAGAPSSAPAGTPAASAISSAHAAEPSHPEPRVLEHGEGQWGLARLLQNGVPEGSGAHGAHYPDGEVLTVSGAAKGGMSPFDLLSGFTCPEVP